MKMKMKANLSLDNILINLIKIMKKFILKQEKIMGPIHWEITFDKINLGNQDFSYSKICDYILN